MYGKVGEKRGSRDRKRRKGEREREEARERREVVRREPAHSDFCYNTFIFLAAFHNDTVR